MQHQVRTLGLTFAALTLAASAAAAQTSDGFETYPSSAAGTVFTTGAPNAGGWKQWWLASNSHTRCFGPGAAIPAHGGSNFIGTQLNSDLVQEYTTYTSGYWDIKVWTYVPGPASSQPMGASQWFILLNVYGDTLPLSSHKWATQVQFDPSFGRVRADAGLSTVTGAYQNVETPLIFDSWRELRVEVDIGNDVGQIYYDGQPLGDPFTWSRGPFGQDTGVVPQIDAVDLYANDTTVPGFMYWDDFSITPHVSTPPPTNYCTGGTTTNGCNAAISASGSPSASATSGFTLTASNVEGQKQGLIFYSISGQQAVQWGTGSSFLCVKSPTQRLPSQSSGGTTGTCTGSLSDDWLAFIAANPTSVGTPLTAGQAFQAQAWFRDPPASKSTSLSNAIEFTLLP